MSVPFKTVQILPSYDKGFVFNWTMHQDYHGKLPWTFQVQRGLNIDGPWSAMHTPDLTNVFTFHNTTREQVGKDRVLYYRVKLTDADNKSYYSDVITPYADLSRRESLIVADIMRRELLQMRKLSGSEGYLWSRSTFGNKCSKCLDPVTGDVMLPNCQFCFGTGREPGYHGPYRMWFNNSPSDRNPEMSADGTGVREPIIYQMRAIGVPVIKGEDLIVDISSDKRYMVDAVSSVLEIRDFIVVQNIIAKELPVTSPLYKLDADLVPEVSCLPEVAP